MSGVSDSTTVPATYRGTGVDIDKAEQSLSAIRRFARTTLTPELTSNEIGHFGGVYPLSGGADRLLVASADGIGTKIKLAFVLGGWAHRQVGADLVNHCVNDILACGARPLFFLDYVAMGKLESETLESLVEGMAGACRENGAALIGGETAEMPGLYADGEYDAAGFIVGEVAPGKYVDGSNIEAGDQLIGLPAVGLHTNGYSLARQIVGVSGEPEGDRQILDQPLSAGSSQSLAEALLAPHPSYLSRVQPLLAQGLVHGMAHITGGGLTGNVPRMIPDGLCAEIDPSTWIAPPIFGYLVEKGGVSLSERYRAFNMGIGFVISARERDAARVLAMIPGALVIGEVSETTKSDAPKVRFAGASG